MQDNQQKNVPPAKAFAWLAGRFFCSVDTLFGSACLGLQNIFGGSDHPA
ncbi:hypothetical protein J2T17_006500 [Paenibacillus mucilaginosus]